MWAKLVTGRSGGLRGMVHRAEGVISASRHLASSQGRQTGKSILPLRTVHYKGLPQRPCLSEVQSGAVVASEAGSAPTLPANLPPLSFSVMTSSQSPVFVPENVSEE
ncbi:unnamed protein product [Pleuronectes platessa]|uniref:Uncharacterized protein n=1 Tax=Pleuronectes platessa TaxID=8262 RepID=A0A9N7U8K3_PLEPL|nr:unnamed protein product [Pleuronectes platessa]